MAVEVELSSVEHECFTAKPLEDLRVWDHVFPGDSKQSAQAIDMESV